jgi:hypothetical protein
MNNIGNFLVLLLITMFTISCNFPKNKTYNIEQLKYSAYYWCFNEKNNNFEFRLVYYIEINKYKQVFVYRNKNNIIEAYKGNISDSVYSIIDSTLSINNYTDNYTLQKESFFIYDGFTYCLDFENNRTNLRQKIQFIPNNVPTSIRQISSLIDSISLNTIKYKYPKSISKYIEELKKDFTTVSLPMPKQSKSIIKFIPPNKKEK